MTITSVFVRKQTAQLPLKYVRLSVCSLLRKDTHTTNLDELAGIQDQFSKFIETPLHKPLKPIE